MRKFEPGTDFEAQFRRFWPVIQRICNGALMGKRTDVVGGENIIRRGPNILIGNHCGSYKDVALLFRSIPRPIFFNANKQLFTRPEFSALVKKHLQRHMGRWGLFVNFILNPYKFLFVDYLSTNIARVGAIPVDLYGTKREAIGICEEYLRRGRAIVSLQGRGRVDPKERNPYIKPFGRGMAFVVYNLLVNDGLDVPVTPMAMFGTQLPWLIPGTARVNIGEPMYIRDYLGSGMEESVESFKDALEARVNLLFMHLVHP